MTTPSLPRKNGAQLTDPAAKAIAKEMFITTMPMLRMNTIGEKVGRCKELVEYWAMEEDWISLRRELYNTVKNRLTELAGDPTEAAMDSLQICAHTRRILKNFLAEKTSAPPADLKNITDAHDTCAKLTVMLHKELGTAPWFDLCNDMTGRGEPRKPDRLKIVGEN